jgi:hypothetical protein
MVGIDLHSLFDWQDCPVPQTLEMQVKALENALSCSGTVQEQEPQ